MNARQRRYLLFYIGIALLTGAIILGIAGLRYEFLLRATAESPPSQGNFAAYGAFSAAEQHMIQGAIDGQRYVFAARGSLPSVSSIPYTGQLTVRCNGVFYTFKRGLFFDIRTWMGAAAVVLTVVGVASVGTAVRRDMQARH